ncbi:MAG TPA: aminoacyl-histidine dipeptidase [Candidatus Ozemobacteraceae bacterium]|nr:aminoacyl-histidine dipeptidase [Candidatus Ozemobacteraceae bacterium]
MKTRKDITAVILDHFERLSAVPRASKKEQAIAAWLEAWATKRGLPVKKDQVGNLLISVPASRGREKALPVILQGHMDMVCEKTPDSPHNFDTDPIRLVRDGDWLHADRTTLGADNGIAIAMAMAVAESTDLVHPPLELLFTVDEESGMSGALGLQKGFFSGRTLINLDSEDEGVFTIGCAGSRLTRLFLPLFYESVPTGYSAWRLKAKGMRGGHSGVNINEERANAIRVLVRALRMAAHECDIRLILIQGGTAHNAIPRDAEALFYAPCQTGDSLAALTATIARAHEMLRAEFQATDPELALELEPFSQPADDRAMTPTCSAHVLDFLYALPHGVTTRAPGQPGLVETSNNMAKAEIRNGCLEILSSQRSLVMSRLDALTQKLEAIARLSGATYQSNVGYPSWQPDFESPFIRTCAGLYKKLFKKEARVEVIHAGLECGIIGALIPGMQMVSIGVTLRDPHSPRERILISSIDPVWKFLVAMLDDLAN